jgi:hypothetical protein
MRRAVPALRFVEKMSHPRWPTPHDATKRVVGIVVALLSILVMAAPIPFGNVTPALVIVLISLAYLEEDGVLLGTALLAAVVVLAATFAAAWETVRGAEWLSRSW